MALAPKRTAGLQPPRRKPRTGKVLGRHDRARRKEFDRVEGLNFESRMMRLLRYRIERIEDGPASRLTVTQPELLLQLARRRRYWERRTLGGSDDAPCGLRISAAS